MDWLQIDWSGVTEEAIGPVNGISHTLWQKVQPLVQEAQAAVLARRSRGELGFAELPYDTQQLAAIQPAAQQVRYRFDHMLVLGIGGSALGLRALTDALLSPADRLPHNMALRGVPRVTVCDNLDPDTLYPLFSQIDWKQTCVNVISKSGKTPETGAQFLIVKELLQQRFGSQRWKDHVIITTDPAAGPLRAMVICDGLQSFAIPPNVGGRFSALSPVGLFPAACAGVDVAAVLEGARAMADRCGEVSIENNPAAQLAAIHYLLDTQHHKPMHVMMPYVDCLGRFVEWYIQLAAESLGKNGKGQTPFRAVGATDQHAQVQLFVDGPNDKMLTMLTTDRFRCDLEVPATDEPVFQFLSGHTLSHVLNTEAAATRQALQEAKRPVVHLKLPGITPHTLGQLLFLYQWQIALLGELYGINAYDQPGVERGKILTREMLNR